MTSGGQKKITEKFNREEEQKSDEEEKENWKKNQKTIRKKTSSQETRRIRHISLNWDGNAEIKACPFFISIQTSV